MRASIFLLSTTSPSLVALRIYFPRVQLSSQKALHNTEEVTRTFPTITFDLVASCYALKSLSIEDRIYFSVQSMRYQRLGCNLFAQRS
jgi:hypothetical protein